MKKTYINPETSILLLATHSIVCASVENFDSTLNDEETINTEKMLSRRRTVWDDEEEKEEDF